MARVIKTGGYFIFSVEDLNKKKLHKEERRSNMRIYRHPSHILYPLLKKNGFAIISQERFLAYNPFRSILSAGGHEEIYFSAVLCRFL